LQGRQIAEDFVIMQLQDEKQQSDLKVDSVKLNYHSLKKEESATNSEFGWIVKVSSKTKLPKITKAVGYFEEYSVETDYITFDMKSKRTSDDTLDFSLPSTQPINELNLFLHGTNFMLPIEIFYKSDKDEEWKKLKEMVLIRDTNRISMADSPLNIKELRIKAINAHFYGDISVEAKRKELDIVFNSANNAPYILVYGSNIAGKASISEDIFLKQDDISYAYLSKEVVLAGEKAYSQKLDDENSAIPKWVIWAILGLGVVFLVFLAFKLSKEIKKDIA
ncbi:MAG: DUF3999 domain-containing protein, partial [Campylobacteraceae bacterium]|jgi:hypothetical protein|nr:DUF3999 domain-containing protein [Campylobacteraceae bacterium]